MSVSLRNFWKTVGNSHPCLMCERKKIPSSITNVCSCLGLNRERNGSPAQSEHVLNLGFTWINTFLTFECEVRCDGELYWVIKVHFIKETLIILGGLVCIEQYIIVTRKCQLITTKKNVTSLNTHTLVCISSNLQFVLIDGVFNKFQ